MNKLIVISGCSSGGKSTLLSELSNNGYTVVQEMGREIVKEQTTICGDITPWQNPQTFCKMLIDRSIAAFEEAKAMTNVMDQIIFFDRSFLEGVSYYKTLKLKDVNKYDHYVTDLRYYSIVFMTPPWKEIYVQDEERKHSFEDAVEEYERLLQYYPECGYSIVEIPKISVKDRLQFVITTIT